MALGPAGRAVVVVAAGAGGGGGVAAPVVGGAGGGGLALGRGELVHLVLELLLGELEVVWPLSTRCSKNGNSIRIYIFNL